MANVDCNCASDDIEASANVTGENRLITVTGACSCPMAGYELELVLGNPGFNPDPSQLVLELREAAPSVGGDATTSTHVSYATMISHEVTTVVIRWSFKVILVAVKDPGGQELRRRLRRFCRQAPRR